MITASLAAFINTLPEFQGAGVALKAFAQTPDNTPSEFKAPFCLVSPVAERGQDLWVVGDLQRKENPLIQVGFYATSDWQRRYYEAAFRRAIEMAKTTDERGLLVPGIDFLIFADYLRNSGDNQRYYSDQSPWFTSPAPAIYVDEDSSGEPIQVIDASTYGSGGFGGIPWDGDFSIDYPSGSVRFAVPLDPADIVRASYKAGTIDFNIAAVDSFKTAQATDVAEIPARYVSAFTLETHFYIKTNANRYI